MSRLPRPNSSKNTSMNTRKESTTFYRSIVRSDGQQEQEKEARNSPVGMPRSFNLDENEEQCKTLELRYIEDEETLPVSIAMGD